MDFCNRCLLFSCFRWPDLLFKKVLVAYFAVNRIRLWLRRFSWYHFDLGDLKCLLQLFNSFSFMPPLFWAQFSAGFSGITKTLIFSMRFLAR